MTISHRHAPVSFWKGLLVLYLVFLAVFFAASPLMILMLYQEADLTKSMLPELIGFCLQGVFLVVIFALYERHAKYQERRDQKKTLVAFLRKSLVSALEAHSDLGLDGQVLLGRESFENLLKRIRTDQSMDLLPLVRLANKELEILRAMSFVVMRIDEFHLGIWMGILDDLEQIRQSQDNDTIHKLFLRIADRIAQFDQLPLH